MQVWLVGLVRRGDEAARPWARVGERWRSKEIRPATSRRGELAASTANRPTPVRTREGSGSFIEYIILLASRSTKQ